MRQFLISLMWWLEDHTEWFPWLSSWFATWSIELDPELKDRLLRIKKEIEDGTLHTVPWKEVMERVGIDPEEIPEVKDFKSDVLGR